MACMVWGKTWRKNTVLVYCDNQAVVEVVNASYCKDSHFMQLLRCLFFITTFFKISVNAVHIAGRMNTGADALSRNNMHLFFSQVPTANKTPPNFHPVGADRASGPPTAPATKRAYTGELAINSSAPMSSSHHFQHLRKSCYCSLVFCTSNNWYKELFGGGEV